MPSRRDNPNPARVPDLIERWSPAAFAWSAVAGLAVTFALAFVTPWALLLLLVVVPYVWIGTSDFVQTRHSVRRNFPAIGRLRYVMESLRPELRQYFVESDTEENPFSREKRSIVYQRSKDQLDTLPFGTRHDLYDTGTEWINHSLAALPPPGGDLRVEIGSSSAARPYSASILNVSAMSFGALGPNAVRALNRAAKRGGFYQNTGEGGLSPYHLEGGGDVVWQVGTGYFGCRTKDGRFDPEKFRENARRETVRMIEIKLSQGAKPGHGGILPGGKVTREISEIRGVPMGQDVISPPVHSAFGDPVGMMEFVRELRELSGGKPVGFKLCVGRRREFLSVCRAMLETGIMPDFVTVDGAEGGTGAAPLEFSNSVGVPLKDGLSFVHNALRGAGVRDRIRVISAGKITTGFHVVVQLALGADLCNSARGMMFSIGCIQALKCNTNRCPVGVATQDAALNRGLVVEEKAERAYLFHRRTVESVGALLAAAGLHGPDELRPEHVFRRGENGDVLSYEEVFPPLRAGALADDGDDVPETWRRLWAASRPDRF